jgi:hypothetical protein
LFNKWFASKKGEKKTSNLHYDSFDLDANLERLEKIKQEREEMMNSRLEKATRERREYLTRMFFANEFHRIKEQQG